MSAVSTMACASSGYRSGAQRFEDYAQYVSSMQSVELRDDEAAGFERRAQLRVVGPAAFSRTKVSRHHSRRTPSLCAKLGLDHVVVYYRLSGRAEMQTGSEPRLMRPGDISFMDLSRPMSAAGPIDAICLGFPRTVIAPLIKDVDRLHGLVLSHDTALGRLAAAHLNALSAEIGRMDPAEARTVVDATANLLAVCANASPTPPEEARVRARPALLVTIRHHIEQHFHDRTLGVESIARRFALSRSTLFRLFHPFGGVEVYVRRRRLARAYQVLARDAAQSGDYVYQVADATGFASASALSRAFRDEFGQTPRDVAQGMARQHQADHDLAHPTDLSRCLQDMVFRAI